LRTTSGKWPAADAEVTCRALDLDAAAGRLAAGGVLILATDTLPGLHARADLPVAVDRVRSLKKRDRGQPLLLLAGSANQVGTLLAPLSPAQLLACDRCWPGPFTLILPAAEDLLGHLATPDGTLAVRVPEHTSLRRLIATAGFPLVSTSVNRPGAPPCVSLDDAVRAFGDRVDGYWPAESPLPVAVAPSCLVDLTGPAPRVLRAGPLPFPEGGGDGS